MNHLTGPTSKWKDIKEKLKIKCSIDTNHELFFERGKQEDLVGRLQVRLGRTKEEVHKIITQL